MNTKIRSAVLGFAVGLAVSSAGAQAAAQTEEHEHPAPTTQKPGPDAMMGTEAKKRMHAMMADPAMRQKMMANMAQCRDMMTMMMENMGHDAEMEKQPPQPKH